MNLLQFVTENKDSDSEWKNLFSKSDIVFLEDVSFEQFKTALANHLFETQYSQQSLDEFIEMGCSQELGEVANVVSDALIDFLRVQNRPKFHVHNPNAFICEFRNFLLKRVDISNIDTVCATIIKVLTIASTKLRESFVNFKSDNSPVQNSDSYEFAHMTGLIGEILATLVFQQIKKCGNLVRTKIFLDNPNMPRHGEDFIGYVFDATDETKDLLHLVEAKSTKGTIGPQIGQIKERFTYYLSTGIPHHEINRLKIEITQKLGDESNIPRKRITRLLWEVNENPNHKQIHASAFLHYPTDYNPLKSTFKELGTIQVTKERDVVKMDPDRIYIITFRFDDFEHSVREIFERAWTI